jgi:hypothetical protein
MEDWLRLRPTFEQYREFAHYLSKAHSWYKHLPLIGGKRFVVFVAPDAGIGRLVAVLHGDNPDAPTGVSLEEPPEGPEFTEEHPRLHYGWTTTKEYRRRFGYLDYMRRRSPDEPYARDAGPAVRLPREVEKRCGFVLYPYVSRTFAEAVTWDIHEEAIAQLRAGFAHPAREQVLELASLAKRFKAALGALGKMDMEWLFPLKGRREKPAPGEVSVELSR